MGKRLLLRFGLIFFLFFILSILVQQIFNINFESLEGWVASFGIMAPLIYLLLLTLGLTVPLNPISDFLLVNLAALIFPPLVAVLATFVAHILTITVNYLIARKFGGNVLSKIISKEEKTVIDKLSKEINLFWIFGLRFLLPLTAIGIDAVSYAAGFAKLPFERYFLASIIPWTILNVLYFYSTSFLKEKNPTLFFLPAVILITIPIGFWALHKKRKRDNS